MSTQGRCITRHVRGGAFVAALTLGALGGCVANSSNPDVLIRSALVDDEQASFQLELVNPGGRNLIVTRIDHELSHGESSFPVSHGTWTGELDLPAHADATLVLVMPFDVPPIEPESNLLHLSGELYFTDKTGFLGLSAMDLTRTPFRADVEAIRRAP